MTIATPDTVFNLLETIVERLEKDSDKQDFADGIRAGFTRVTRAVDVTYLAEVMANAMKSSHPHAERKG